MTPQEKPVQGLEGGEFAREIHLAEYWAIVVKRRLLIALTIALSLLVTAVVSFLAVPLYRATTVVNVEKEKGSPLDIGIGAPVFDWYNPEFLPTQTRLIRSREIAERVVRRLHLETAPAPEPGKKKPESLPETSDAAEVTARIAMGLQGGIEVNPIRGTTLVEVSYTASSPKDAARIANAVADSYVEWTLESKYRVVGQASQFLGTQIEQLKAAIDERERQLQAYGRSKDIISVDPQTNMTLQALEALNRDYTAAQGDRISKQARYLELQETRPEAIAETISGDLIRGLRGDLLKAEREYAEKLNLFKPDWPPMQQLKAQIERGRQHLNAAIQETVEKARESAKTEYQTALRKEENLKSLLRTQKTEAMTLNSNAVEYMNLHTEVATKRTLLDALFKRQSETEVMARLSGARESSIRVVDRALPPTFRFKPSYRQNATRGLFVGIALGIGLAFFLEYLDRSIRTVEQVERTLGLPAFGIIPAVGPLAARKTGYAYGRIYGRSRSKQRPLMASADPAPTPIELFPHTLPRTVASEAYRAFRTALLLSRAGGVRSVVITSGYPGEGKTSTAVNLSVVIGQLGKRVLLIDADLHKPRLHEVMRVSNRAGLVSVLAENADLAQAIQATHIPGVSLLPAGPMSPNPSGLLSSVAMDRLLERAAQSFDFVVIDSPPVQAVADALLLGHLTDGVVLCIKGGVTPRERVVQVRDKLLRSNVVILGVLINNLVDESPGYGDKYYYSGYRSGYLEDPQAAPPAKPQSQAVRR